jgi:hypothetical protein
MTQATTCEFLIILLVYVCQAWPSYNAPPHVLKHRISASRHYKYVLFFMYCIVLSMMLFSYEEWMWWFSFKNWQACGYQVPPSVETRCSPYSFTTFDKNLSATNIFLSFDIFNPRTSLLSGSIVTQSQISSESSLQRWLWRRHCRTLWMD